MRPGQHDSAYANPFDAYFAVLLYLRQSLVQYTVLFLAFDRARSDWKVLCVAFFEFARFFKESALGLSFDLAAHQFDSHPFGISIFRISAKSSARFVINSPSSHRSLIGSPVCNQSNSFFNSALLMFGRFIARLLALRRAASRMLAPDLCQSRTCIHSVDSSRA